MPALDGCRVAAVMTEGFEQVEFTEPKHALEGEGARVEIVAPSGSSEVQGFNHADKADKFAVDATFSDANPDDYDAVLLPGGVFNSDQLRADKEAQKFVRAIDEANKPIAVICHGAWLLISAGVVRGRTLTAYHTLEDDIDNAGGNWADGSAVEERNWVSARNPDDLPDFCEAMVRLFTRGRDGQIPARPAQIADDRPVGSANQRLAGNADGDGRDGMRPGGADDRPVEGGALSNGQISSGIGRPG